ncbi:MAG TPA: S-adenosylmethionine decarboxylase, partial [Puia sp.]|nr:S-adenosylmethionine decarboxylase [Puia sp.]
PPAGFTAVVCLSESHISVHTWPEHGRVNLDIYLSNHLRDNDGTTRALYEKLRCWFDAEILQEQTLKR